MELIAFGEAGCFSAADAAELLVYCKTVGCLGVGMLLDRCKAWSAAL